VLSRFTGHAWMPCPSGYTRGQGWGLLHKAWIGYKRANNPRNGESFQDRLQWAIIIQNVQTDLGLQRASFPNLGLLGDYIFLYDQKKELELQTEEDELWLKEYKKKKASYIKATVHSSMLSEQEIEWMNEYASQCTADPTYDNENKYAERITMPNFFDARKNYHN
jgi:hypothetical protein